MAGKFLGAHDNDSYALMFPAVVAMGSTVTSCLPCSFPCVNFRIFHAQTNAPTISLCAFGMCSRLTGKGAVRGSGMDDIKKHSSLLCSPADGFHENTLVCMSVLIISHRSCLFSFVK